MSIQINFVATTAQAEELLDTKFAIYRNEFSNIDKVSKLMSRRAVKTKCFALCLTKQVSLCAHKSRTLLLTSMSNW